MKFVTFGPPGAEQPGVLRSDGLIAPAAAVLRRAGRTPLPVNAILANLDMLLAVLSDGADADGLPLVDPETVRPGPPVPHPEKIIVVGGNYQSHVDEAAAVTGGIAPTVPILVFKPSNTVIGPTDTLVRPLESEKLDYEIELAVIIGRGGHRIPRERALEHVAGYAITNDVTARDVLMGEMHLSPLYMQLTRGKGFPTFSPLGPWLVTTDEVPQPNELGIRCWVNGELRQDGNTSDMIMDVPGVIESVSSGIELSPGDVLMTGTPAGVGGMMDPPRFLFEGDVVEMEIEGLGRMRTPIADERAAS